MEYLHLLVLYQCGSVYSTDAVNVIMVATIMLCLGRVRVAEVT